MPICLTCLESNANQPINSIHKTLNLQIRKVIEFCITIKLEINQNYPTAICTGCLSTLTFIYEFKQKVLENFIKLEKGLHSQLANKNVKEEPKDVKPIIEPIVEEVIIRAEIIEDEIVNKTTNEARNNDLVHLKQCDNNLESDQLNCVQVTKEINTTYSCKCKKCDLSFINQRSLVAHMGVVHRKVLPFFCTMCCKVFKTLTQFENHQRTHTNANMCKVCYKCFCDEVALQQHSVSHDKPNNVKLRFQCKLCSSAFTTRSRYNKHIKSHNTVKAHSCSVCQKQFSKQKNLKAHNKTHIEKPFYCEVCNAGFFKLERLQLHYSKKHPVGV